jgi:hypothetical protein
VWTGALCSLNYVRVFGGREADGHRRRKKPGALSAAPGSSNELGSR